MTDSIFNLDATALFYAAPTPDHVALLDTLNAAFDGTPDCYVTKSPLSHDNWWLLSCGSFHIMLSFQDAPAPQNRFAFAVSSPVNTLSRFEYGHAAQNHNTHITIEIGDGNAPLPPEARRIMQELGTTTTCDPALKMKALHVTGQFLAGHPGFLALHFAPSDRLLSADDLRDAHGQDVPFDLLFHPVPTELGIDAHGRETWSLRLKNPHHLPGPSLELEGIPRAVPLGTAVSLLRTLTRAHRAGRLALKAGDTISPTGKWALHVFCLGAHTDTPNGRIVLSFYKERIEDVHEKAVAEPAATPAPRENLVAPPMPGPEDGFAAKALAALRTSSAGRGEARSKTPATPCQTSEIVTQRVAAPTENRAEIDPIIPSSESPKARKKDRLLAIDIDAQNLQPVSTDPDRSPAPNAKVAPANAQDPRKVSLLGWMVDRCRTLPADARTRTTCIVLAAGVLALANPYHGFTGGHDTLPGPQTGIATKAMPTADFAELLR